MRFVRIVLSLSVLMLASLACKTVTGLGAAQTEIPEMITAAPSELAPIETAAAESIPTAAPTAAATAAETVEPAGNGTAPSSGLGIAVDDVKSVMEATQQFIFKDGVVDGQPAVIASLAPSAATNMPGLMDQFSAAFIGDPKDLGEVRITVPYSDDDAAVQAGLGMVTILFSSILPPEALFSFIPWITENYSKIPPGGSEELVVKNLRFRISRVQSDVLLSIQPVK
jgi:hypothetical protein